MRYHNRILLLIFNLFLSVVYGQEQQQRSYKEISALFEAYPENDERAMVFVNLYVEKAKNDHNLKS